MLSITTLALGLIASSTTTMSASIHAQPKPVACNTDNSLQVHVYHLAPEPVVYQNSTSLTFSPTAFTLVSGQHEAILVDAPATTVQGQELAAWVESILSGKQLKAIYITHGHGDHFFAARTIQDSYPNAKILATKGTAEHIAQQYEPDSVNGFWALLFPNKIDYTPIEVETLPPNGIFDLEGHTFQAVEVGQGDTHNSTVLHVPDLDLVVGGDVVYGNCHQLFAEDATTELRTKWLASLDKVAGLEPKVVVPSHMRPDNGYAPSHIQESKDYIHAYEEFLKVAKSWEELENLLKGKFPDRDGSFILRWSVQAPFNAAF